MFVKVPRSLFGSHSKIEVDAQKLDTTTPSLFVSSVFKELVGQLNVPPLSEDNVDLMENIVKLLSPNGIVNDSEGKKIVIDRPTSEQLGHWALIMLLILAMYTFPHESTTRYPRPNYKKETPGPFGYEDYNGSLGIVSQLGRMGYFTMLVLDEIKPELEAIAMFYPVVESKMK